MSHRTGAVIMAVLLGAAAGCARQRGVHGTPGARRVQHPTAIEAVHYRVQVAEGPFAAMHLALTEMDELYFPVQGVLANVEWEQHGWTESGPAYGPKMNAWYGKSRNYPAHAVPDVPPGVPLEPAPATSGEASKPEPLPPGVVHADPNRPLRPERRVLVPWDVAQAIFGLAERRREQEEAAQTLGVTAVRAGLFPDRRAQETAAPVAAPAPAPTEISTTSTRWPSSSRADAIPTEQWVTPDHPAAESWIDAPGHRDGPR